MSKILRRPMFRGGGKVSSYGNGIATGLADGGRVGFKHGGTHARLTLPQQKALIAYQKPGAPKYTDTFLEDRLNEYKDNLYTKDITDLDIAYGMQMVPPMTDDQLAEARYFEETPEDFTEDFYSGKLDGTDYNKLQSDQLAAATLAGEQDLYKLINKETAKKDTPTVKTEEEIRAGILAGLKGKELTDEEKLAEVEKDQALFEKMLGGGKEAKIQDASDMAISFASKALGEGATVKSAFADFLADETKRPSRRMKVKDAATQAAIQSYLTGKTSYQKFQDQIALTQAGIDMKLDAAKPKNLSQAFTKYLKTNDKATDPGIMSQSVEEIYGEGSFGGELKPDVELIVGKVYYGDAKDKSSNKILYLIDKNGEPQFLKTVYR